MAVPRPYTNVHGARAEGLVPAGEVNGRPRLIAGLEGTLNEVAAVRREVKNQSDEIRIVAERQTRMSGVFEQTRKEASELTKAVEDTLTSVTGALVNAFTPALDAAVGAAKAAQATAEQHLIAATARLDAAARPEGWRPGQPDPNAVGAQAAPALRESPISSGRETARQGGRVPRTGGGQVNAPSPYTGEVDADTGLPVSNAEMWQRGRGVGVGEIRGQFRQTVASKMSNYAPGMTDGERLHQDAKGRYRNAANTHFASHEEVENYESKMKRGAVVRNYGRSIYDAGSVPKGIANALPGAIGKGLGWVGAAYTVGNQVLNYAEGQRKANNEFVAIEGGGQMDAMRERAEGRAFRLQNRFRQGFMGGMGGEDADRLFKGATAAGWRGDRRDEALDFGMQNFKKYGMEVAETLELLTIAAQHGQHGLSEVGNALESVTEAAAASGVNAKEARENFVRTLGTASDQIGGQGGATVAAGGVTAALASLGEGYQGIGTQGLFGDGMIQQIARTTGQSFGQVAESQNAEGGVKYAEALQANLTTQARRTLGGRGGAFDQALSSMGSGAGENGKYSQEQIEELGKSFEDVDPRVLKRVLEGPTMGLQGVTTANARDMMTSILTGNFNPARQAEAIRGEQQRHKVGDTEGVSAEKVAELKASGFSDEQIKKHALRGSAKEARKATGIGNHIGNDDGRHEAASQYERLVREGNKGAGVEAGYRSPMLEKFLKNGATNDTRVKIKGKDGDRVMTLKEAFENAPDQLESGNVEIMAGKEGWKGKTIADATGMEVDESVDVKTDKKKQKDGHHAGYWEKRWGGEQGAGAGNKGGVVSIEPTEYLKKLLTFRTSGNVQYGVTTPPTSDPGPGARPTGATH